MREQIQVSVEHEVVSFPCIETNQKTEQNKKTQKTV
jgi:hypothetical protein